VPAVSVSFDSDFGRRKRKVDTSDQVSGNDDVVLSDETGKLGLPQDARDLGLKDTLWNRTSRVARIQ